MRERIELHIMRQQEWIRDHGKNLAGYLERYGDPSTGGDYYGNGGRAIYEADQAELVRLQNLRARGRKHL